MQKQKIFSRVGHRSLGVFGAAVILCLLLITAGPVYAQQEEATSPESVSQYRLSQLLGQTIINKQGQEIGQVYDVVVSLKQEQVKVILSVGGFLGLGDKKISVPLEDIVQKQGRLICDLCKSDIQEKPGYDLPQSGR